MRFRPMCALLGTLALGLAGCAEPDEVQTAFVPAVLNRDLDLLFVVDNSGSMAGEQASLAANFPVLRAELEQLPGGLPNVHLGIVSSNVGAAGQASVPGCAGQGDDGNLQLKAGCTGVTGQFLSDLDDGNGGRTRNYTGNLDTLFACMAQLGTGGCGFEMHLESAFRALQLGKNPGFLRRDAHLAIVILADEDDCSTEMGAMFGDPTAGIDSPLGPRTSFRCHEFGVECDDDANPRAFGTRTGCRPRPASQFMFEIDRYVGFLRNLKVDPAMVTVAGIVGIDDALHTVVVGPDPGTPANPAVEKSCFIADPNDPTDGAAPPIRLAAFLKQFGGRNAITSICAPSLADALRTIGALVRGAMDGSVPAGPDAGVDPPPGPDAGIGPGDDGDGYNCVGCGSSGPGAGGWLTALAAGAVLLRRRRRP